MAISVGDKLPSATLRTMGADGPEEHATDALCAGKKVVFFGLPGAFTGTCTTAHLPRMLADPDSSFTKALGLEFTAPPVGLIDRSKRYAMLVDNGTVSALEIDENPGECTISAGESFLLSIASRPSTMVHPASSSGARSSARSASVNLLIPVPQRLLS